MTVKEPKDEKDTMILSAMSGGIMKDMSISFKKMFLNKGARRVSKN